ncbi:MAG: insulinase family protein [bacterium]|nr:insulinase family protein [bacterium]
MRRFLVLMVSVALAAAACGGDAPESPSASPPAPTTAAEPPPAPAAEPSPSAEPAGGPPPEPAPAAESAGEPPPEPAPSAEPLSEPAEEPPPEPAEEPPPEPAPSAEPPPAPTAEPPPPADEPPPEPAPADEPPAPSAEPASEPPPVEAPAEDPAVTYAPPEVDPTPLPADPAVYVGTLDNGLTYYLRNNEKPGSNLSLRLAVKAGSLHEAEAGLGVAHFLEHMMFNGTEEYPRNEVVEALRTLGVEFGPDLNAYTWYDMTVYKLDVVTTQAGAVQTAFKILSQWGHAATIAETDVVEERGIVRDELRLRYETGAGIINRIFDHAYVVGTPYEGRQAIGTAESIESMTPETLRAFYETWYVPSNMALVVVGDLPVEELEALVEEHFGAIPAGEAPPAPDTFSPIGAEPAYLTATSPSQGYSYMSLDLKIPPWNGGTVGGERLGLMEGLIALMLDARLKDAYEQGFLSQFDPAKWDPFSYTEGIRFYGTNLRAEDLAAALGDYWSMVLSLEADGFSDADLELAAEVVRTDLEFELQSVGTKQDHEWAELYVAHFLEGADIGPVAERAARIDALLEEMQSEELTEHFRWMMREAAPIVIAVGADRSEVPTVEEMRAATEGARAGPVPERTVEISTLMEAPEPVAAVSEGPVESIEDAYEWTFANGATVVFVPSDISEAQVDMRAVSQGGWSAMEAGERPLTGRLAVRAVSRSGVAGLGPSQVQRLLEERNVEIAPFIAETEEGFAGSAASDGIESMFQMLHLLVTAPQVDAQAFSEAVQIGEIILSLAEVDLDWRTWIAAIEARHPDSFEWFDPVAPQEVLDALSAESLLDRYLRRLGDVDDLIVAVAGDIDRDTVQRMARTYVGTLPAGEADTFVDRRSAVPAGVVRREVVLPPDAMNTGVEIRFETPYEVDVATGVAAHALATILDARLVAEVREELAASYSTGSIVTTFLTPSHGVEAQVLASGDPEFIDRIHSRIIEILADLTADGPSPEEWAEARAVLNAEYTHDGNADHLAAVLRRAHAPEGEIPTTKRQIEELEALEPADVQALAAALFDLDQRIEIIAVLG